MFTFLVRWQASTVNLPLDDVLLVQFVCPLNNIIVYLHREELTHLSINIGFVTISQKKLAITNPLAYFDYYFRNYHKIEKMLHASLSLIDGNVCGEIGSLFLM